MCIGIKPVFLPLSAKQDNIRDVVVGSPAAVVSRSASPTTTPVSISRVSRKRPLNEEISISTDDLLFCQQQQRSRKMMRYSSCTCQCENGGQCQRGAEDSTRTRRKVRFGAFKTFVPAAYSFDAEEQKELWYGLDECAKMNEASKMRLKAIRSKENKDMLRHVLCVASQCSYHPAPLDFLQMVRLHFEDDTRGLELGLLPLRIRQRRQEHIKRVVEVQKQIISGKIPLKNDANLKAKALAIQSLRSSQASKLFAELLARNVALDEQQQAVTTMVSEPQSS